MKGGVGKTTCSVGLAFELAESFNKKVLFIDLDPQTNASIILMNEENYQTYDRDKKTIADAFDNSQDLLGEKGSKNDINDLIIENIWRTKGKFDLIPSSIRLFEKQQYLNQIPYSESFLKEKLQLITKVTYDYCIIDCPPDFDKLVISALGASNFYLIPIRPDYLSQQGLIVLENKLQAIKSHLMCKFIGIIINLIPTTKGEFYKLIKKDLENKYGNHVLGNVKEYQVYSKWPDTHKPLSTLSDRNPFIEIAKNIIEFTKNE